MALSPPNVGMPPQHRERHAGSSRACQSVHSALLDQDTAPVTFISRK